MNMLIKPPPKTEYCGIIMVSDHNIMVIWFTILYHGIFMILPRIPCYYHAWCPKQPNSTLVLFATRKHSHSGQVVFCLNIKVNWHSESLFHFCKDRESSSPDGVTNPSSKETLTNQISGRSQTGLEVWLLLSDGEITLTILKWDRSLDEEMGSFGGGEQSDTEPMNYLLFHSPFLWCVL